MRETQNGVGPDSTRVATVGVFASAVLVGSHCVSAILFAVFGTTFGLLAAVHVLEPYRLPLTALGLVFWGYGFYRLYFQAAGEDKTSSVTACQRIGSARTMLWLSLCALVTMSLLPTIVGYLAG
jgi:hypothetical protein